MSGVAKILIVLNLILAVVFLGSASTFLGARDSWLTQYKEETARLQSEIDTQRALVANLQKDKAAQEGIAQAALAEQRDLETRLALKEQELQQAQESVNTQRAQLQTLSDTHRDALDAIEQGRRDLARVTQEKETAEAEKRQAIANMNDARTEQKRLNDQLVAQSNMIASLEGRVNEQSQDVDSLTVQLEAYKAKYPVPPYDLGPAIQGTVSAVNNDLNIVVLSVGRDDKVEVGSTFTIFRGDQYVGKVVIDRVDRDYASGYSNKDLESQPIQVGDAATTRY